MCHEGARDGCTHVGALARVSGRQLAPTLADVVCMYAAAVEIVQGNILRLC